MIQKKVFLRRTLLVLILAFLIPLPQNFLLSTPAYSQESAESFLQEGIAFYETLYVDEAIIKLNKAIELGLKDKDNLTQAYQYLAFAYVTNGQNDKAKESFGRILKLNPLYELDKDLSPKILEIFSEAQKDYLPTKITAYRPRSLSSPASSPAEIKKKTNPWLTAALAAGAIYLISQATGKKVGPGPPIAQITNPPDGARLSGTVEVRAEFRDDRGLDFVYLGIDGPGIHRDKYTWWLPDEERPRFYVLSIVWDTILDSNGDYVISVEAEDVDGQSGGYEISVSVNN